jgi:KTSC domain
MSGETHIPKSSHIKSLYYDKEKRLLTVTFSTNNKSYTHSGVSPEVYGAMVKFPSAGKYYHRFIRDKYKLFSSDV